LSQESTIFKMKQPALGKKIAQLRREQGLTQEELVEKCNISVRTIQRIESGEVTPRSYTIKTIFTALEFDFSQTAERRENSDDIDESTKRSVRMHLQLAIIAGIVYFIVGFPEGYMEYIRMFDYIGDGEFTDPWFYSITKLLSVTSLAVFLRGFWVVGKLYEQNMLKYGALIFATTGFFVGVVDVASLFHHPLDIAGVVMLETVFVAIAGVFFGAALAMSRSSIGDTALVGGILEIAVGTCLITFVLSLVGLFLLIPTIIVEIIILYQVRKRLATE